MEPAISSLLASAEEGDRGAADALFAALYAELQRLARKQRARDGGDLTLGTTSLLHEAYLDMAARERSFPDRNRFMGYAARVMRTLIVDHARRRRAQKRGGGAAHSPLDGVAAAQPMNDEGIERLGEALERLAAVDPALAQVVDLRFFCGFSFVEIAALQGVSERTVQRHWEKARLYLHGVMGDEQPVQR